MKIYGPYLRKDGRKHLCIINADGTKTTKSYSKHILEQKIGRQLTGQETTDHIDNNKSNDDPENLQVLSLKENSIKAAIYYGRKRKIYSFVCPVCQKEAFKPLNYVLHNKKLGKSGPYCSRVCAGKSHT